MAAQHRFEVFLYIISSDEEGNLLQFFVVVASDRISILSGLRNKNEERIIAWSGMNITLLIS